MRRMTYHYDRQDGFTLVELIIAMAIFSFMLLIILQGFLSIVRIQQSGMASRNTQQNARIGLETMIRTARFATRAVVHPVNGRLVNLCLFQAGSETIYFVNPGDNRLYSGTTSDPTCTTLPAGAQQLLSTDVQVTYMLVDVLQDATVPPAAPPPQSVRITLSVVSDISLLDSTQKNCDPTKSGSQFCSATTLVSSATLRGTP